MVRETLNDYLYPEGCYDFETVIQLGQFKDIDVAQVLYDSALNLVNSNSYHLAETVFKDIIQTYPVSKYATASMKDLFYLQAVFNQDYQTLQNYYDSLGSEPELTGIHKLAGFLSNHCNIKLEEYQSAINWNDSDSPEDLDSNTIQSCLNQNYPNPFKDKTIFSFTLHKDSDVSMCIYDQIGRQVFCFPHKYYESGTHSIDFINEKLAPGVYYYRICVDNKPEKARKLIIL
jgi:hypothetical protein